MDQNSSTEPDAPAPLDEGHEQIRGMFASFGVSPAEADRYLAHDAERS